MKPKVVIDNSRLLARMKRYEEVTGKQITATMRRGARLLAVSMATSTQPYGKNSSAQKLGERAVQNDILRVYRPGTDTRFPLPSEVPSFAASVKKTVTKNPALRDAILGALGLAALRARSARGKARQAAGVDRLNAIFRSMKGASRLYANAGVNPRFHKQSRNASGRVAKNCKANEIVTDPRQLVASIRERQQRVGMTKAAWAAAALKVNSDVKDALSGIPAWVKRHVSKVPSRVVDTSESIAPKITLTNSLPWADKALRSPDMKEAIRISREKFYKAMGIEIRHALRAEKAS